MSKEVLQQIKEINQLSDHAKKNIIEWLTLEKYAFYRQEILELVEAEQWQELEDGFFRVLPFGTGGRRGRVGLGSARMNRVTVGETAQALCEYLNELYSDKELEGVVVAYDVRNSSKEFAEYLSHVLAGNNIKAYLFDGPRATPELSFAVRHLGVNAGIMITASHNPASDNGIKLYWADGGQLVAPHDTNILRKADEVAVIHELSDEEAREQNLAVVLSPDIDTAYQKAVLAESCSQERDLKIAYSPLHGTGITNVYPVLQEAGFDVHLYEEQAEMDGDFTNVAHGIANPELPPVNQPVSEFALKNNCDIAVTNDPDADRFCVLVNHGGEMVQLTGNQSAILMTDYLLDRKQQKGELTDRHFISSTIVTTEMLPILAEHYRVNSASNLLVGFKYIGEQVHLQVDKGEGAFVCGAEESYGGVVGEYARDKDGASPVLVLAELAAELKKTNKTLIDKLDELYDYHGYCHEALTSVYFEGAKGFQLMKQFMHDLRQEGQIIVDDQESIRVRDYIDGEEVSGVAEDVLRFEFTDDGRSRVTIRPSGTEPKLKFYVQLYDSGEESLSIKKQKLSEQSKRITASITGLVEKY